MNFQLICRNRVFEEVGDGFDVFFNAFQCSTRKTSEVSDGHDVNDLGIGPESHSAN